MIKIKANDTTYMLPTAGGELTLGEYLKVEEWAQEDSKGIADLVSALSGLPIDDAVSMADKWHSYFDFNSIVSAIQALPSLVPSMRIDVGGKKIKIKGFWAMKLGQRILLRDLKEPHKNLARVLAICISPQVYGKKWAGNLDLLEKEVEQLPAKVAIPLAYFFLSNGMSTSGNGRWFNLLLTLILSRHRGTGL